MKKSFSIAFRKPGDFSAAEQQKDKQHDSKGWSLFPPLKASLNWESCYMRAAPSGWF